MSYIPLGTDADSFRIAALDTGTVRHGLEKSTYAVRVVEWCASGKLDWGLD